VNAPVRPQTNPPQDKEQSMIVIVVEGGVVQAVFSDEPEEDVKVLDLDDAEAGDDEVTAEQMQAEIVKVEREMHPVW